ncbi:MAG: VgrG-related protein [Cyanobacteria bacterium RM1_2_2]|nr:VgrG-related protein [Cyanobacteria bacterium RM1_2_2]
MPSHASYLLSQPFLTIDGRPAPAEFTKDILKIVIEESLHLPAMFTIVLHNNYLPASTDALNQPWRHQPYLEIGKKVEIGFGNSTTQDPNFRDEKQNRLITGEITAIDVNFTRRSESHLILRGYDLSHRLHRGRHNRSFQNLTDSDIVQKIAQEIGLNVQSDDTGTARDYVFQENQTNMEFLRELSARHGFELFVQDNILYFRKPQSQSTLELRWLRDINRFNVRMSSAQQVSAVEVRGWDYENKQSIVETASTEVVITETENGKGSEVANQFQSEPKMIVVDQPIFTADQAKRMAQSLCDELGGEFIEAEAQTDGNGNPEIRVGRVVDLKDLGNYSGQYYITETKHHYHEKVYSTDFTVRGLRDGSLLSLLSPKTRLQPGQTLMVGIVTNNKDPKGWGRVKVRLPTLTEDHESNWARIVALGAGQTRGFDWLPEVEDEVLVGFEHGDIHRPYVIGGVWNGKDNPPENINQSVQGGKVRLRTIKTRTGHMIQFADEAQSAANEGILIQTASGHKIQLNDSDRSIKITTSGGQSLSLDDQGQSITIQSALNLTLDAQATIVLKAPTIQMIGTVI